MAATAELTSRCDVTYYAAFVWLLVEVPVSPILDCGVICTSVVGVYRRFLYVRSTEGFGQSARACGVFGYARLCCVAVCWPCDVLLCKHPSHLSQATFRCLVGVLGSHAGAACASFWARVGFLHALVVGVSLVKLVAFRLCMAMVLFGCL